MARFETRTVWVLTTVGVLGLAGAGWWADHASTERVHANVGSTPVAARAGPSASYSHEERRTLLKLARASLIDTVKTGRAPDLPEGLSDRLLEEKGCFVTLTVDGRLRGCIGHIFPQVPLAEAVIENARSAAIHDSRFSPVRERELEGIDIEVSVLTVPSPLEYGSPEDLLVRLRPGVDGVVLDIRGHRSTFLPQVWEQLPDKVAFLSHLAAKAGQAPDAWRGPDTGVLVYQAEAFDESELGAAHEKQRAPQ